MKYPPKMSVHVSIAIPSSFASQVQHPIIKAYMVSQIARAAAIFRIENIIIYLSSMNKVQKHYQKQIAMILNYLITPQYLRKKIFPKTKLLRYAGVLPPLQTPNHPFYKEISLIKEELREGIILRETKSNYIVDVGLSRKIKVKKTKKLSVGSLVLVHLKRVSGKLVGNVVDHSEFDFYLRYNVISLNGALKQLLDMYKTKGSIIIGTSRFGVPYDRVSQEIKEDVKKNNRALVVFGGPKEGLLSLGSKAEDYDFFINVVPNQGVKVIRTEEAVLATLSLLANLLAE